MTQLILNFFNHEVIFLQTFTGPHDSTSLTLAVFLGKRLVKFMYRSPLPPGNTHFESTPGS